MQSPDRFIASCRSWSDFRDRGRSLSRTEKGQAFERLTQLYLQTAPEYRTELQNVWMLRDVPSDIRRRLNLPKPDEGIDLIAATRRGEYWAIQCKFLSDKDGPLTRRKLGTFTSLAFNTCNNIALAVVAHTSSKPVGKRHLMRHTVEIGLDRFQSIDRDTWSQILGGIKGRSTRPKPREPRPHQKAAVAAASQHFLSNGEARGRLIMPCATGKSLTAYWIAEALKAKTIVVAVPSLALIRQSLSDWTREFLAHGVRPEWICVCSDESVGNLERDEFVGEVYELGLPTHTDTNEIAKLLRVPCRGPKIVFTTYQSSGKLAAAARKARTKFDLAILDEAHKTVQAPSKPFATLLNEKKIKVHRRLFMTATERIFRGDRNDVLSMDSDKDYGKRFYHLSFKQAIKQHIIADYKIVTVTVSDDRILSLIKENRILDLNLRDLDEAEAQAIAAGIALKRVYKNHQVKHAISFHRSIQAADRFREQQDALNRLRHIGPKTTNLHISSKKTAGRRNDLLLEFIGLKRALMTNARCLTEGINVPAIDCVMFADPKQSRIDIVQAAGRALRQAPGKTYGYIVIPLIVPEGVDFDEFAETSAFKQVARTITALSTQDERIADEFRAIEKGRISSGKIVEIEGDVPIGMKIRFSDFAEAISTRVWESVGKANWRPFTEARLFARSLGLSSASQWRAYCKANRLPSGIPTNPNVQYLYGGWTNWADWLGTTTIATNKRRYRSYAEAKSFVHGLALKSANDWRTYTKSGNLPKDIPVAPNRCYSSKGWTNWADWLGTGTIALQLREYLTFGEGRALVRTLGLKSKSEWDAHARSGRLPPGLPRAPHLVYADAGWNTWGDWLGSRIIAPHLRKYRSYHAAKSFVHGLDLKSANGWRAYTKSGNLPKDIPACPNQSYSSKGWTNWADWLGYSR